MKTCETLVVAVLLVAVTLPSYDAQVTCHDPFILIGNYSCLFVPDEMLNWNDARDYCRNRISGDDTDLALLDDCSQLSYIWNYLAYSLHKKVDFWVGGSDIGHEGVWLWDRTNNPVALGVPFWHPGQPDGSNVENHLTISKSGYFADAADSERYNFICQSF